MLLKKEFNKLKEELKDQYMYFYTLSLYEDKADVEQSKRVVYLVDKERELLYEQVFNYDNITNYIDLKDIPDAVEEFYIYYKDTNLFDIIATFDKQSYENFIIEDDHFSTYSKGLSINYKLNADTALWEVTSIENNDVNLRNKNCMTCSNIKIIKEYV